MTAVAALTAAVLALLLWLAAERLAGHRSGRLLLLGGAVVVPLVVSVGGLGAGVAQSSQTSFCLSCHEMQPHGRSLFVAEGPSLAATHFQSRLINRDLSCYNCHKDYALFGDVRTKLNGLRHVWVHYLGDIPSEFTLYQPYTNANCLHCHDDARSYLEVAQHQEHASALARDERSCLSCHRVAHDLEQVQAGSFWEAVKR